MKTLPTLTALLLAAFVFLPLPTAAASGGSDRYREDADRKSWARFTAFLKERLR